MRPLAAKKNCRKSCFANLTLSKPEAIVNREPLAFISRFAISVLLSTVLFTSCGFGPEVWEPHVLQVRYAKNNKETGILDLTRTGPTVVIDSGDSLELTEFILALLPTQRDESGMITFKIEDLPPVPDSALAQYARVLARMRKTDASGRCYDKRDQVFTDWFEVQPQKWIAIPHKNSWKLEQNWDEIRIDVELRSVSGYRNENPPREFLQNIIMLEPTTLENQLQRNTGQSIFSRISDAGERFCTE